MNEDKQHLLDDGIATDRYYQKSRFSKLTKNFGKTELFLVNYSVVAIFQSAIFTYMIGSLSTLEKRYAFESKISGFILIADNISQIFISPLIGYLGNKYNRPRIMAIGELISALSCFVFIVPYFIYGPAIHLFNTNHIHSNTTYEYCRAAPKLDECHSNTVWTAVFILFLANFFNGVGYSCFYSIAIPYIDDNTSKKSSPVYLSATSAMKLLGPAFGLLLSSKTLELYEKPTVDPGIITSDPRWIGCWWIGFVIIGILLIIFSIPLAFYPEIRDSQKAKKRVNKMAVKHQLYDAWNVLKRLIANPIFVFHVLGINFKLIGFLGYYVFKPKYIESQYRQSASDANFWVGSLLLPSMAFGIITSGIVLAKFKPKARSVAVYTLLIEIILSISILYPKIIQCPPPVFPQMNVPVLGNGIKESVCYEDCHCSTRVFQPVCSSNHLFNYFSPCHAGCAQQNIFDLNLNKKFLNCKCDQFGGEVTDGYCPSNCNNFLTYIIWFGFLGVITSTIKVGDTIITLRCVDPEDKNFALGITGAFLAIFAFIPYPIIFGSITDSACKIWKQSCGETGNCWLYDVPKLTDYLHNCSFFFMIIGTVFHIFVVIYAKRIPDMFSDDDSNTNSALNLMSETIVLTDNSKER